MMEITSLKVKARSKGSKSGVKAIRRNGGIPAIVYGPSSEPRSIELDSAVFRKLYGPGQKNSVFGIEIEGEAEPITAIVHDLQKDVITQEIVHLDFKVVEADKPVTVEVPVVCEGVPVGVKTQGGRFFQVTKKIRISCLPANAPEVITVDINDFESGFTYYVKNIDLGEATLVSSNKSVLFSISKARGGGE
jgi:large subunit ribosomal protein L25